MKKVLSFALVLALILGSFSMVFAADFSDVESTDPYAQAVDVLTGLGIVSGYKDGTYKPEKVVTRAEMAALIINALGLPVSGTAQTRFSDVPATHWASGFINYAASMNIISGYPDGTFKPDKTVSYDEALTMVINAIGYNADSVGSGSWPGAYINRAFTLGLLDTSKSTGSAGANRGDIACILFDALNIPLGATNKVGEFVADAAGKNTFAKRNNADDFTPKSGVKGDKFIVEGTEASLINLKPYVGAYATATAKDGKIISLNVLSTFVEGKIASGKLAGYTLDFNPAGYQVEQFNNGKIGAAKVNVTTGATLKFAVDINGNYITKIHSEIVWTSANVAKLTAAQVGDISKAKLLGKNFLTDKSDKIVATNFDLLGVDSLADIKKDNVVKVYDDGTWITRIEVGTEVVTGEVAMVGSDGKVTIGGKAYEVVAALAPASTNVPAGSKGTFYLNYDGEIFEFVAEAAAEAPSYYGMLLGIARTETKDTFGTVLSTVTEVKLLQADGTVKTLTSTKKLVDDFLAAVTVPGDFDPAANNATFPKAVTKSYPVKYELNDKGELSKLTTVAPAAVTTKAISSTGVIDNKIISDKTVIVNYNTGLGAADWPKAATYRFLKKADVAGKDFTAEATTLVTYILKGANVELLVIEKSGLGVAVPDDICGIVTDYNLYSGGKSKVYALVDGKQVEYDSKLGDAALTTIKNNATFEKFTFTADDGFTGVVAHGLATSGQLTVTPAAASVSGNFFVNNGAAYSLSANALVYVKASGKWSVGSVSDLDGLAAGAKVTLINTAGTADVYELVLIEK